MWTVHAAQYVLVHVQLQIWPWLYLGKISIMAACSFM